MREINLIIFKLLNHWDCVATNFHFVQLFYYFVDILVNKDFIQNQLIIILISIPLNSNLKMKGDENLELQRLENVDQS